MLLHAVDDPTIPPKHSHMLYDRLRSSSLYATSSAVERELGGWGTERAFDRTFAPEDTLAPPSRKSRVVFAEGLSGAHNSVGLSELASHLIRRHLLGLYEL